MTCSNELLLAEEDVVEGVAQKAEPRGCGLEFCRTGWCKGSHARGDGHEAGNKNQRKKAMSMRRCVLKPRYNFVLVFFD